MNSTICLNRTYSEPNAMESTITFDNIVPLETNIEILGINHFCKA